MQNICVYCGSSAGVKGEYTQLAARLAQVFTDRSIGLVYGGGKIGLMRVIADEMLARGGHVTGVITRDLLAREVGHTGITQLHVVDTMHERKALMASLSDGFIALPGGYGTYDEFFEAITWTQLAIHDKPCALLDTAGFYAPLYAFLTHAKNEGFIKEDYFSMLLYDTDPAALIDRMSAFASPDIDKARWILEQERSRI